MQRLKIVTTLAACGLWLAACGQQSEPEDPVDSVDQIAQALESENGGYDQSDERPGFGLPDLDDSAVDPGEELPDPSTDVAGELGTIDTGEDPNDAEMNRWACPHGRLAGVWKHVRNGFGVFRGRWASANGQVVGHLRGIWGQRQNGERRFVGKYISADGRFRGLLRGRYARGHFRGQYFGKNGARGVLDGIYGQDRCTGPNDPSTGDNTVDPNATGGSTDDAANAPGNDSQRPRCLPGAGRFIGRWRALCRPPICQDNRQCGPGQFCRMPDGRCLLQRDCAMNDEQSSDDLRCHLAGASPMPDHGICTPRPDACPRVLAPVCGCDRQTYPNACVAFSRGVSIAHRGACEPPPPPLKKCVSNEDCLDAAGNLGQFCFREPGVCLRATGAEDGSLRPPLGICRPRPEACYEIFAPVCGCDGTTYGNDCMAYAHGVSIAHPGPCQPDCCGAICRGLPVPDSCANVRCECPQPVPDCCGAICNGLPAPSSCDNSACRCPDPNAPDSNSAGTPQ